MAVFTVFRKSTTFITTLTSDKRNLELHRDTVFYSDEPEKGLAAIKALMKEGHLVKAAIVTCKDADEAYYYTNSINYNWINNPQVTEVSHDAFLASTSVGDIFQREDGSYFVTCDVGFADIDLK